MTERKAQNKLYYFILFLVLSVLLVFLIWRFSNPVSTLAMEQQARCGIDEHIHTEDCYIDNVRVCTQKEHTHSQNCYLVLLEDNDINWLLQVTDEDEEKSLENVIDSTLVQALTLNEDFEGESPPLELTSEDISSLNTTITENEIEPAVVFNEDLSTGTTLLYTPLAISNEGVSTLAVGDKASTDTRAINFYIQLDGNITFINSGTLTNNNDYTQWGKEYYSYTDTVKAYTDVVVTNLSTSNINNTYYFCYNTTGTVSQASSFNNNASYQSSRVYFANSSNAQYAILTTRTSSGGSGRPGQTSYTYTPVNFWTVTLDYTTYDAADLSSQSQYVQNGLNSTLSLSDEYEWVDTNGNTVDASALEGISEKTTLYAKPKTRTVSFETNEGTEIDSQTVSPGGTAVKPADPVKEGYRFDGWYTDEACTQAYDFSTAVTRNITLYAKWTELYRVTYINKATGQTLAAYENLEPGSSHTFDETGVLPENCIWIDEDGNRVTDTSITVNANRIFYAVSETVRLTYLTANGNTISTESYSYGSTTTIVSPPEGYVCWTTTGEIYYGGESVILTEDMTLTASNTVTISFDYIDASDTSQSYSIGRVLILPLLGENRYWVDQNGTVYQSGSSYTVTAGTVFTEKAATTITLNYNLNFTSTTATTFYDSLGNVTAKPTLNGRTTASEDYSFLKAPAVVLSPSSREVGWLSAQSNGTHRSVYFLGWQVSVNGEAYLIEPGTRLSWEDMENLAGGSDKITLTGLWEDNEDSSLSFYIQLSAYAADSNGNVGSFDAADYTGELFFTHLFDDPDSETTGEYNDNRSSYSLTGAETYSAEVDAAIRKLYGEGVELGPEGDKTLFYTLDFPKDEEILAKIKTLVKNGTTVYYDDGTGERFKITDSNTIDADHYTIRWYVLKPQGSEWHVDGKLVQKKGTIKVTKTFGGNQQLIDWVKEKGFSITAINKDGTRTEMLSLTPTTATEDLGSDGGYISYNADTGTYTWTIYDVKHGEEWTISENLPDPTTAQEFVDISEWITVDSTNATSASGIGTSTTVTGVAEAADVVSNAWLRVDFTNMYHMSNTILIRKIDGNTGQPLSGAVFNLYQKDADGTEKLMTFDLVNGIYCWNEGGSGTTKNLTVSESGYLEYSVEGFSYEAGDIIVQEIIPPGNYNVVGDVVVGYMDTEATVETGLETEYSRVGIKNPEDSASYAQYSDGLLTVKNFSNTVNVTAVKTWDCEISDMVENVEIWLLANGQVVSSVIPGTPHSAIVNAAGNWQYTWENLPIYVDGSKVEWSILEVKVGDEVPDGSGNFPNWAVSYSNSIITSDGEGREYITLGVQNAVKRARLWINKYDTKGNSLSGAQFKLTELDSSGNDVTFKTVTIGSDGRGLLDNLKYETWYRLEETKAPDGYWTVEAVQIKISSNGTITVEGGDGFVRAGDYSYNVDVTDSKMEPLPETGGEGWKCYIWSGLSLILVAIALGIKKKRRKEDITL